MIPKLGIGIRNKFNDDAYQDFDNMKKLQLILNFPLSL